jgi:hypothetical protein
VPPKKSPSPFCFSIPIPIRRCKIIMFLC